MKATIYCTRETLTYTVQIYDGNGTMVLSEWCGSYAIAERIARSYEASITNIWR